MKSAKCRVVKQIGGLLAFHSAFRTYNSALLLPGRLIRRTAPFEGAYAGANPAPAASFGKSSFDRSVVIAIREANVSCRAPESQGLGSHNSITSGLHPEIEGAEPSRAIILRRGYGWQANCLVA